MDNPTIMLSKRANIFYIEYAKVVQKDNKVVFLQKNDSNFFNIPDKNTSFLLLGTGTSLSSSAAKLLADSNVIVGFTGSGGSPLSLASDISFFNSQSVYRPTEYMQQYIKNWLDPNIQLKMAKILLIERIIFTEKYWKIFSKEFKKTFEINTQEKDKFISDINICENTTDLLLTEARFSKLLYHKIATSYNLSKFKRIHSNTKSDHDNINIRLNQANAILYGYAAVTLHGLGLNYSFPILHGKTRKGALVYDIADLLKDAICLPLAFEHGTKLIKTSHFKSILINTNIKYKILDTMFKFTKNNLTISYT